MPHLSSSERISTEEEQVLLTACSFVLSSPNAIVSSICDSGVVSPSDVARPAVEGLMIGPGDW